jgi:hypothetical protein
MGAGFPERWSRQRSGASDCLVSVLYGRRSFDGDPTARRPLFHRTTAADRTSQVVVSLRSITNTVASS